MSGCAGGDEDLLPPRAPCPVVKLINHHVIELEWGEYLDRLHEVFTKEDGRISVEVQCKHEKRADWELIYAGYGRHCSHTNLDPETKYYIRMRFRNKHGAGKYSSVMDVSTTKPPLTGVDIHKAVRMDDCVALRKILSLKEANVEAQDDFGFTPLQMATSTGKHAVVDLLLEFGANTETPSDAGKTALMMAAHKDQLKVIKTLLDHGADIDRPDKSGLTALHIAVDSEKPNAVAMLLKCNANINARDNVLQWTPLHRLAGLTNNGKANVGKILIKFKAELDALDRDGKTPLMLAALNGHVQLTELLLDAGARYDLENEMGHTAMRLAETNDRRLVKKAIEDFIERCKTRDEVLKAEKKSSFRRSVKPRSSSSHSSLKFRDRPE